MQGVKRVLIFCILIVILPTTLIIIPLYLRRSVFADVIYPVAESDIIEIRDGISSIFCQQHSLRMNTHFNAFQLRSKPEISTNRKHIRLKKSMTLPDDTLEYWGFYLLKGALVHLKFCSRYDGSRILVVKGERVLQTCNLLDHNKNKIGANFAAGHEQVKVFFEDITEIAENTPDDKNESVTSSNGSVNKMANLDTLMEFENSAIEEIDDDPEEGENSDLSSTVTIKPLQSSIPSRIVNFTNHDYNNLDTTVKAEKGQDSRQKVYDSLYSIRRKRDQIYDRKYSHGGNAINFTETDESNSISSFENGLFECYNGAILLAEGFPPIPECVNAHFLENGPHHMTSKHEITEDGYYYYIFYSDNDLVRNDIHAIFDIYKPTFQYSKASNSQDCVNATNCTFPIGFLSDEIVIVEVPTRDGIEHEEDDITYLVSTCHPRIQVYAVFPILILLLLLCCSFL